VLFRSGGGGDGAVNSEDVCTESHRGVNRPASL
jgi:hypothetical protein